MKERVVENLAGMWIADMRARNISTKGAMTILNIETGKHYSYKRWWEWASGKRAVPSDARGAMLRMSLPYILKCFAISLPDKSIKELARFLN